jgi:hypothetical protein
LGAHVVKSRDNRRDLARFTLDIYARHPASDTGFWWRRLGELLPWFSDSWWRLSTGADPVPVSDQVGQALTDFAWPALNALLQIPGLPGSSLPRLWQRPLGDGDDGARARLSHGERLREQQVVAYVVHGWTTAELIDRLASDSVARSTVIFEIMRRNLQDDDVAAALADRLEHDTNPVLRGHAARAYGSLALDEDVPDRLQMAADEDRDLDVRWNARFALSQRDHYGPGWLTTIPNQWWRPSKRPSIYDVGPGVKVSPLPPAMLAQLPAEAARRGMTVEELTVRVHLGLPMDDPLVAFWRSREANEPAPSGIEDR